MAARVLVCILCAFAVSARAADTSSPIAKVIEMISDLQTKIIGEGQESQKVYEEFAEWCEDRSKQLGFEIKTGKATSAELNALIDDETSNMAKQTAKIESLADAITTNEADLKAATGIRAKENADFTAADKELVGIVDMLGRAHGVIEREMGGASMLQLKNAGSIAEALSVMVSASAISSADASKLTALVQSSSSDEADDAGAPAGEVYASHSSGILDTLASLTEKAEAELESARSKETEAVNNFAMLKQSLDDEIKFASKDMAAAKKNLAASGESKSKAEGDLDVTTKDLKEDTVALSDLHHNCMTKAQEFEDETNSRNAELKAIAEAKKIVIEATSLSQVSLMQVHSRITTGSSLKQFEAVRFVRDLARKTSSPALAQLASHMEVATRSSGDVFAKIKGLIGDMIQKLEEEASADAEKKAYCDKELSESNAKNADKTAEIEKLSAKIDQMNARSAKVTEEAAALSKSLAEIAASQKEMDALREEENKVYVEEKATLEKGLDGIKLALKVLRDYYAKADKAHGAADGASSGIIGLLEVCESDFSQNLAEVNSTEQTAQGAYDQETKDNEIETTTKTQDVKYKTKESADLNKAVAEASNDRSSVQEELDAVNGYLKKLHDQCDEKVESYAEKKRRREAEIAGLKEALTILEDETALVQTKSRRHLRAHSA